MRKILMPYAKNSFSLKNHIVMAPMTRSRATRNIPNELMSKYYEQRSGAGLIITEGTSPTPEGLGYSRIPGIFSDEQVEGWKKITEKVHSHNSKIFVQFMHTGRIGHQDNLPKGSLVVGPSSIKAGGQISTETGGMQDHSQPHALSTEEIQSTIEGFVNAAKNAITAGFDGVEIHGAHGYLLEQFLNPNVNNRLDEYSGTIENRSRFTVEVVSKVSEAIGKDKVGIRFSPFSKNGDMETYENDVVHQTYSYLAEEMEKIGIAYIHISDNPAIPERTLQKFRDNFSNTIILCNGLTPEKAEQALQDGFADLVAFGRLFITNPDLVDRIEKNIDLKTDSDYNLYYSTDAQGYIDYPIWQEEKQS